MITSSFSRLASASTCLQSAKSPLCELAVSQSEKLCRSYTTAPYSEHVESKNQKHVVLPKRPIASNSQTSRPITSHVPHHLQYQSGNNDFTSWVGKQKKHKAFHKREKTPDGAALEALLNEGTSTPTNPPRFEQGKHPRRPEKFDKEKGPFPKEDLTASDTWLKETAVMHNLGPPVHRIKVSPIKSETKVKPTVVKKVNEEALKTLPVQSVPKVTQIEEEASESLGPGFVDENWKPESWESDDAKVSPPHFVPTVNVTQGKIGADVRELVDVVAPTEQLPVASLAHGLDRVLFNPGVHWLQDPRSHVYNFSPWLEKIPKVNEFAFEKLTGFISSSQDDDLRALAKQEGKKFTGSTSSLSGMLSHIYFLISEHKDTELETLSQHFSLEPSAFTAGQRMPAAVTLKYKDGIYAVDSFTPEYEDPDKNVLTWMGTLLENFLTKTPDEFKQFMRLESKPTTDAEAKKPMREAYRFSKSDKFIMRSQLDCRDTRLPGTGVFDIKTRACISVRMDILNFEENSGYWIKNQHGIMESFEREYYDLVRSAFLKYSFQVRIGNMDGVMVAYHNTDRIFGFQYISLDEMDERIYGPVPRIGDKVFKKSISLLEAILDEATKHYPDQSITCMFETRRPGKLMDVFVQPAEWTGKERKPVTQFLVQVSHSIDGKSARSAAALRTTTEEWTMDYSIAKAVLPDDVVKHNLAGLEKRKSRTLVLPASVTLEQAKHYWENLSYNPKLQAVTKDFNLMNFTTADQSVQKYRDISLEGRVLYAEHLRKRAGLPKIVLGQGVYEEEESLFFKEPKHQAEKVAADPEPESASVPSENKE